VHAARLTQIYLIMNSVVVVFRILLGVYNSLAFEYALGAR
jgi:hypothetical protein